MARTICKANHDGWEVACRSEKCSSYRTFWRNPTAKEGRRSDFWRLDSVRFAAATPSAAFDGRVDALLGKPRAMGLPVGMTLDRIVDTEGHNFTARWLLALCVFRGISCGDLRRSGARRGSEARRHHPIRTRRQANRAAPDCQIKKLVKDPCPHHGCAHQMVVASRAMSRHLEGGNRTRGRPLTGMGRETPPETCLTAARREVRIRPPALVFENWRLLAAPTLPTRLRRPHPGCRAERRWPKLALTGKRGPETPPLRRRERSMAKGEGLSPLPIARRASVNRLLVSKLLIFGSHSCNHALMQVL